MKKQRIVKILATLSLCFFLIGGIGISTVSANATDIKTVSISENKLYIGETEVTAESANFKTSEKASVYLNSNIAEGETDYTGIRFFSWINDDVYNSLVNSTDYNVTFGTMVANKLTVTNVSGFTKEYLTNTENSKQYVDVIVKNVVAEENEQSNQKDVTEFSAVIYGINETNYATQRMARAYMTVTSIADENTSVTIYADYNKEESRCIADVAMAALQANDYDSETVDSTETDFKKINAFAMKGDLWQEKYNGYDYVRYISTFDELKTYATDDILKADGSSDAKVCLVMKNDISAEDVAWVQKNGYPTAAITELNVTLDGNGKKLTVVMAHCKTGTYWKYSHASVFGVIGTEGVVRNLIYDGNIGRPELSDAGETVYARAAGFAYRNNGLIENCYLKAEILSGMSPADTGNALGMLQLNTGTIQNVICDLRVWGTAGYQNEDSRKYGIAVANNGGTIKNSVSINATSLWKISSDIDMINGKQDNSDGTYGYSFGAYLKHSQYSGGDEVTYLPTNFRDYKCPADSERSDCYTFASLEDLLSGTGKGDATADNTATTYETITAATAQEKLGSAWTFDAENNIIKLKNTIIFEDLLYTQGVIYWKVDGTATVSVNGTQVGTTETKKFDIASYFKENIGTLNAGDVEVSVSVGGKEFSDTFTIVKPSTLNELMSAAANEKAYIYLESDIDLSSATWTSPSTTAPGSVISELNAVLEGNGFKLFGLTHTKTEYNEKSCNAGFIGKIGSNAVVRNLLFSGSTGYKTDGTTATSFRARVGIFAYENAGTIENCYIQGKMYSNWGTNANSLFGAIFINNGTIQNTVTEIMVKTFKTEAEENFKKFGFAVCNYGTIKNCVTVSAVSNDSAAYDWMSATGGENRTSYSTSSDYAGEFTFDKDADYKVFADTNRTDSYIFTSYESLISGNGYGFKGENEFSDITSQTAQDKLGSAWTFVAETKTIKLLYTVIYSTSD